MVYELRHFDTPLLRFSAENGAEPDIRILWLDGNKKNLLPLDLPELTDAGLSFWLRHRTIPKNRAYVDSILGRMGLSINRPMDVIRVSKGLSLNDCYWVTEEHFDGTFAQYNLYDNRFSRVLGQIAFTGAGSSGGSIFSSSPEFTTNGMLPKCWRRENGVIRLYKGGTEGASNLGFEPYSEFLAAQIAQVLEIDAIPYGLSNWKGRLCSTCTLFTDKALSFVPVSRLVREGGIKAVRRFYAELGDDFVRALNDMFVLDAVIFNTDRHFGNFGVLVDSETNRIVAPAPLFDHGNSLFSLAGADALANEKAVLKYADHLKPCVYDSFTEEAKAVLTHEKKNRLRRLLDYRFRRHNKYHLPDKRLTLIETAVHARAAELLK